MDRAGKVVSRTAARAGRGSPAAVWAAEAASVRGVKRTGAPSGGRAAGASGGRGGLPDKRRTRAPLDGDALLAAYVSLFDFDWYRGRYDDSPADHASALAQLREGIREQGRCPNACFLTFWYMEENAELKEYSVDPFLHYLSLDGDDVRKPHPLIDTAFIRQSSLLPDNVAVLKALNEDAVDYVNPWFSRRYYRAQNPDLFHVKDLENHFLTHGIREGRFPSKSHRVVSYDWYWNNRRECAPLAEFTWEGTRYCVLPHEIPDAVFEEIDELGVLDPAVYAVGPHALRGLNIFDSTDIGKRDLIDHRDLLRDIGDRPEAIVFIPRIGVGGGEKYAAQLAGVLSRNLGLRTLVLVTESLDDEESEALKNHALRGFKNVRVLSFHRYTHRTWKKSTVLALLLMYLRPRYLFNINCDTAAAVYELYGKALSNFTRLFVCYFSESPKAIGAPFSARYLGASIGTATVVSDNNACIEKLRQRMPGIYGKNFFLLPQYCERAAGLDKTNSYEMSGKARLNILWIGRIEGFKRVELLMRLARDRPDLVIHMYSPDASYQSMSYAGNLIYRGACHSLDEIPFNEFDIFLFTSRFEGMPNIVLECALKKIPVVCADVGGLRETFHGDDLFFYANADDDGRTVQDICAQFDRIRRMDSAQLEKRLGLAAQRVSARHDKKRFVERLSALLQGDLS